MELIKVVERLPEPQPVQAILTLPFELRQKSRLRAKLDSGEEVGLMLERGQVLRNGDCLRAENGLIIEIKAAPEAVSTIISDDPLLLARACYHLGNRHVPLQIEPNKCRYLEDHVLDDMVIALGLTVSHEQASFEPEAGAYGHSHTGHSNTGHSHSHSHGTDHHHHHD
jgi:urease accessory protein